MLHPYRVGVVSGLITAILFYIIHEILILDIWYGLIGGLIGAGILGASIAWVFVIYFDDLTAKSLLALTGLHLAPLIALEILTLPLPNQYEASSFSGPAPVGMMVFAIGSSVGMALIGSWVIARLLSKDRKAFWALALSNSSVAFTFGHLIPVFNILEGVNGYDVMGAKVNLWLLIGQVIVTFIPLFFILGKIDEAYGSETDEE